MKPEAPMTNKPNTTRRARALKWSLLAGGAVIGICIAPVVLIGVGESFVREIPQPATEPPDLSAWYGAKPELIAPSRTSPTLGVSIVKPDFPADGPGNLPLLAANVEKYFTSMTLSMANYGRAKHSLKIKDRFNLLIDIHYRYTLLQGQIDAVKTWSFATPEDPRGENWQATAERWFDRELLEQTRIWMEAELAGLVTDAPEPDKDSIRKQIALRFSTEGRDSDLSRDWVRANWDLGAHYWREVGGVEGRWRLAARELERRYSLFYDKTRGTKVREALPRRLDLD